MNPNNNQCSQKFSVQLYGKVATKNIFVKRIMEAKFTPIWIYIQQFYRYNKNKKNMYPSYQQYGVCFCVQKRVNYSHDKINI
jgi:hypothetical protein